ncbi:MAG: S8 family peptidase [Lunatimonas sp.]|uniref:S8 family peptidase n=1 Tax=Lunatimonas sp. TaxID=2060141 RepID=UPI00263AC049|nr:S8 family peptidase [Lunatimonas sp.]MCC5937163.1 S8 family peptidase [Lunatimonas sp.]
MRKVLSIIFMALSLTFSQAYGYYDAHFEASHLLIDSLKAPKDWFLMDPADDGVIGTGAQKAHELLKDKQPKQTVIVAVIDSGVDIAHEDLQGKIWVNQGEIPGNGIDDDKNGYVDDVHGWNFIGGKDGSHIAEDSHELTREYVRLKAIYGGLTEEDVKKKQRKEFAYWQRIEKNFESDRSEAEMNYNFFQNMENMFIQAADIVKEHLDADDFGADELAQIDTEDTKVKSAVGMLSQVFNNIRDSDMSVNEVISELAEAKEHFETQVKYAYNPEFNPRDIVGDDPEDYKDRSYGNNDPTGPDSSHGTHVAGIIAADRNNDLGIQGIAEHVLIMPIRAVPNGDERDKDIANSIYYAVDNGAHIINMSFGKSYSPGKKAVDKAVKYAERKGVVLIHAAGNSSKETTPTNNYPNRFYEKKGEASNWLEIGASSWQANEDLPASFTNFSSTGVDFFAPGVDIYSTMPGGEYKNNSGTSMAAPTVAGVAALLLAYYPELKPDQVRQILKSTVHDERTTKVNKPGADEVVTFGALSRTGGVVNAYSAIQMAESMTR